MKRMINWLFETPRFVQGACSGTVVGLVLVALLQFVPTASALSVSAKRDCNPNAVINCGALTTDEVIAGFKNAGVADIYSYFGISASEVDALGATAVAGQVSRTGTVTVNGRVVATGAMTAGRQNIPGSAKIVHKGTSFYSRPPKVSFSSNSLTAFVVMKDGTFQFAILASCGNPVIANAVKPPVKPVVKTTPKPTITTAVVEQPQEETAQPQATPVAQTLPNTGPGEVGIVVASAILGGAALHFWCQYWRMKTKRCRCSL